MKRISLILGTAVLVALLAVAWIPVRAQQEDGKYFPETGHTVAGEFWKFYNSLPDPLLVFGYPITDSFSTNFPPGLRVQYFQRARFELHPELPEGQRITLTSIGSFLYTPGAASINLNTPGACRTLPNGFSVCYDFLAFYEAHGGAIPFGYPISSFEILPDGRIVQYFERARFEWHPELQAGANIVLADVGRIYFDRVGEEPRLLSAASSDSIINDVLSLRTLAFVLKAVTAPDDTQTLFIVVQSQAYKPVEGAVARVWVRLPTGDRYFEEVTNRFGIAVVNDLAFTGQPCGNLVEVLVSVDYGGLPGSATTSFRIWR